MFFIRFSLPIILLGAHFFAPNPAILVLFGFVVTGQACLVTTLSPERASLVGKVATAGAALGLALSWRIAQQMGCMLSVESTPGAGSTFTLAFNRSAVPPASASLVLATDTA